MLLRSKNPKLENVAYIAQDDAQNNSGHFDFFCDFIRFKQWTAEICFLRRNLKYNLSFPLEILLGSTKTKKEKI